MARAIGICQDSVTDRLNQSGYSYVTFQRTTPDNNSGHNLRITGTARATGEWGNTRLSFTCSVDSSSGRVRYLEVRRR